MKKLDFWKSDWFLGVVVVVAVFLFYRMSDLIPSLERKAYDLGVTTTARAPRASPPARSSAPSTARLAGLGRAGEAVRQAPHGPCLSFRRSRRTTLCH